MKGISSSLLLVAMFVSIQFLSLLSRMASAQELQIDAESFEGDTGTMMRANKARLRYGERTLSAGKLLYDTEAGSVQASEGVTLEDGANNRLGADMMDFFPLLSRAVASGNVRFENDTGLKMFAQMIRYEIERDALFIEGPLSMSDAQGRTLKADAIEYYVAEDNMLAKGGVLMRTPDGASVSAAQVRYRPAAMEVAVDGEVDFADGSGLVFSTSDFRYNFDSSKGSMSEVELRSEDTQHFVAASSARSDKDGYRLDDVFFTTCDVNDPAWSMTAESIMVDNEQVAHATGVGFRVGDRRLFGLRSFSYSLSNERRSGFLVPNAKFESEGEFSVEIPFYLNLAPNYDALLRPRLISGRGFYGAVEGRWLMGAGNGNAELGFIDDNEAGDFRSHWEIVHSHAIGAYRLELDASGVSDDAYGDDFFSGDKKAQRHFIRNASISQEHDNWSWSAAVTDFQTIQQQDDDVSRPFASLPAISVAWDDHWGNYYVHSAGSFDRFHKQGDPANGDRWHGDMKLQRLLFFGGSHSLSIEGGVAGSHYSVKRKEAGNSKISDDNGQRYIYEEDSSGWLVPYASVDVRPQVWTRWQLGESNMRQLLEPRLFVGVVRRDDFDDVPVYDSERIESSYQDYFFVNPFVGGDRFEDTNFISYGIETKMWLEGSSNPWLAARVAQRYRARDSKVRTGDEQAPLEGISNALAEMRLYPNPNNTVLARLEWNPDIDSFVQGNLEAQQLSMDGHAYLLRYTLNEEDSRGEIGLGVHRVITPNLQMAVDANYDLDDRQYGNIGTGVRYQSPCRCWSVNFFVEQELLATDDDNTSFSIQIDLQGLGGFGLDSDYDQLVEGLRTPL